MQAENQKAQEQMQQQMMLKQAGQFASASAMDPSKNPGMNQMIQDGYDQLQNGNTQGEPPTEGGEETPPEG
jgi:hypothetical protein